MTKKILSFLTTKKIKIDFLYTINVVAILPPQPCVCNAIDPSLPPRHVGPGAYAEHNHAETRLRGETHRVERII